MRSMNDFIGIDKNGVPWEWELNYYESIGCLSYYFMSRHLEFSLSPILLYVQHV
jgi:hypothetical protein